MRRPIDPVEAKLWAYVRQDLDEAAFEAWVYASPDLDAVLGSDDYLALAACNYRETSRYAHSKRIDLVRDIVTRRFPRSCDCLSVRGGSTHNLGGGPRVVLDQSDIVARQTPWIDLRHCGDCGTDWLVGTDTVDDFYELHRVSDEVAAAIMTQDQWPDVFKGRDNLWPDAAWLKGFGFESLEAWRARNPVGSKRKT